MRRACGPMLLHREDKGTGMKVCWKYLEEVERREGGLGIGWARWMWWAVAKRRICLGIYVNVMDSSLVRGWRYLYRVCGIDLDAMLDTIVTPFTSDYLSAYLSICPSPGDAVLSFGPMDTLMAPAQHYLPTKLYSLFPHPAQDAGEKRRYIALLASRYSRSPYDCNDLLFPRNADVPRALVRDMYTKSWSAFDRLVAIVPPGGSIGYVCRCRWLTPPHDRRPFQPRRQALQLLASPSRQLPALARQRHIPLRNRHQSQRIP